LKTNVGQRTIGGTTILLQPLYQALQEKARKQKLKGRAAARTFRTGQRPQRAMSCRRKELGEKQGPRTPSSVNTDKFKKQPIQEGTTKPQAPSAQTFIERMLPQGKVREGER